MKQLLFSVKDSDLHWEYFRCGGKGGQKQNKTSSGARVTHIASGISCESREERQQIANRKKALEKLAEHPRFILGCKMQYAANQEGFDSIAQKVEQSLDERNLTIETSSDCVPGEIHV